MNLLLLSKVLFLEFIAMNFQPEAVPINLSWKELEEPRQILWFRNEDSVHFTSTTKGSFSGLHYSWSSALWEADAAN